MTVDILQLAAENQAKAQKVIEDSHIVDIWKSVGAEINLVGSLKTGLLMKNRDIDFHIYTDSLNISNSFAAMTRFAENPAVKRIEYGNLINTEEECIEWHAWYEDEESNLWQLDLIHIKRGSTYDGYFENVTDRIAAVLTPETKYAILNLKYESTYGKDLSGIVYYMAVIRDGIRTYDDFEKWLENHPVTGIIDWIP